MWFVPGNKTVDVKFIQVTLRRQLTALKDPRFLAGVHSLSLISPSLSSLQAVMILNQVSAHRAIAIQA